MMLTPAEYYYLKHYKKASGIELLKLTLRYLILKGIIKIEPRYVLVHRSDRRKRLRFFFIRGVNYNSYQSNLKHENFILKMFQWEQEFPLTRLVTLVKKDLAKSGLVEYKERYVIKDLRAKKLIIFFLFPNRSSKLLIEPISRNINKIQTRIDHIIENGSLSKDLRLLGHHILNLDEDTIIKICGNAGDIVHDSDLGYLQSMIQSFDQLEQALGKTLGLDSELNGSSNGFGGPFGLGEVTVGGGMY